MVDIQQRFKDALQYDAMMGQAFPGYGQLSEIALCHLRTRLGRQARVLDVGCGTGSTLIRFARHEPAWTLVGVDPAEAMVGLAREKTKALDAGSRLGFHGGTVDTLPEQPPFDAAVSLLVEHLLPDDGTKLGFLKGISERLVSGGSFVLFGLHGDLGTPKAQRGLDAWMQFIALAGLPETVQAGVRQKATREDSLVPEERIRELLGQAGFTDTERIYQAYLLGGWVSRKV